jgi:hypothetical protein
MWRRYVLTFLIFVLGFEIGAAGKLLLDRMTLSDEERVELLQTVKQSDTPGPIVNQTGPLMIEYSHTEPAPDGPVAVFMVTNVGGENIYFSPDGSDAKSFCRLHESRFPKAFSMGSVGCLVGKIELKPSESTGVWVPVEKGDLAYYLTWNYFVGVDRAKQGTSLVVSEPGKLRIPE